MNREAVQHERGPRNATIRKQMTDMFSARQMSPSLSFSPLHPLPRPSISNFYPFVPMPHLKVPELGHIKVKEEYHMKKENCSPMSSPEISNTSNTHSPSSPPSSRGSPRLEVCEKAAKILFMNSRWVRSLPTFQILPTKDQETLYRNSWLKLFLLGCAQFLTVEDLENIKSEKIRETEMVSFISAVRGLQSLRLSDTEHACVRGVVLFKHGRDILDQMETRRDIIAAVADQAHVTLAQAMMIRTENNSLQFAKMMMILAGMDSLSSDFIHELFFRDTIGDISMDVIVVDMVKEK